MKTNDDVMVSVLCTTYNHGRYISRAIDSFLSQRTSFRFEILIHDDASTDGTTEVVRSYEEKHPDVIRVFYEEENQYHKGKSYIRNILIPAAKGKYVAFCEGDDFWVDDYKLQKQFDYMEEHPECSLHVHANEIVDVDGTRIQIMSAQKESGVIPCSEVIKRGGGFVATNSIFAPAVLAKSTPSYFDITSYDYVWQMFFASKGTTYFSSDIMSAYRKGVEGSWSQRNDTNKEKTLIREEKKQRLLKAFDEETDRQFHEAVEYRYVESLASQYIWSGDRSIIKDKRVRKFLLTTSKKSLCNQWIRSRSPKVYYLIRRTKTALKTLPRRHSKRAVDE